MRAIPRFAFVPLLAALAVPAAARAAAHDGVVDTAHVSHVAWLDRRPLCPVDEEGFTVQLRALRGDLTFVSLRVIGDAPHWIAVLPRGVRGEYDLWEAELPAASGAQVHYYFELFDGPARYYLGPSGASVTPPADSGWAVDFVTNAHAPLGATPLPAGGVMFRVWAPGASTAAVRGEFNAWGLTPMQRLGEDFIARVPQAIVNQQYKYFFDGATWAPDARGRVLDPAGFFWNSRIADPTTFAWTDSAWQRPALERMVIYQLNVGTFCGLNDPLGPTPFPSRFVDVAARVQALAELGVNAVQFNPVTSTPDLTYAGYSTLNPWSPQFEYGMPDDFKALVDAFHRAGIAVLCDIVWNHVDPGTTFLWNYDGTQAYFETPAAQTPWGPQAAFGRRGVDDYYVHSALHWLDEYHVDGFRFDAAAVMAIEPHPAAGWALMQRFTDEVERRHTGAVRIAEYFPVRSSVVLATDLGGAGFDATYNGDYRSYLRFGIPQPGGFAYLGAAAELRTPVGGLASGRESFNYFELHDDAWGPINHRFVKDVAPTPGVYGDSAQARMRVALGLLMLTPGIPAMLMGDEWLETADWGTGLPNRLDWALRAQNAAHLGYVQDLVAFRQNVAAFAADAPSFASHTNYSDYVFSWVRHDAGGRLYMAIVNPGDVDFPTYLIGAPLPGTWLERLNSQAAVYGGTGLVNESPITAFAREQDGYPHSLDVRLARNSVIVLQAQNTADVAGGERPVPLQLAGAWPNPARGTVHVRFSLPRSGLAELAVFDVQGRHVETLATGELAAGGHDAAWDGRGRDGRLAAPGVYLLRLRTAGGSVSRRIVRVP